MMKELLRVQMNRMQVMEACREWAADRASPPTSSGEWTAAVENGLPDALMVEVVFRTKRAPKPRKGSAG